MIPRGYNDGPDVTYISCAIEKGGERNRLCAYIESSCGSLFVRSWRQGSRREFRRCGMLSTARIRFERTFERVSSASRDTLAITFPSTLRENKALKKEIRARNIDAFRSEVRGIGISGNGDPISGSSNRFGDTLALNLLGPRAKIRSNAYYR